MRKLRERLATIILIALLAALPVAGGFQLHLLNEAQEAEISRLSRLVEGAGRQFRSELAYDLAGLVALLSQWRERAYEVDALSNFYGAWADRARFSGLVQDIAVLHSPGSDVTVYRHIPETTSFVETDASNVSWITAITDQVSRADRLRVAYEDPFVFVVPTYRLESPGLAVPRANEGSDDPAVVRGRRDELLVRLDREYLADTVLPVMVDEYLGSGPNGFHVALLDTARDDVLFATTDVLASDFALADGEGSGGTIVPDEVVPVTPFAGPNLGLAAENGPDVAPDTIGLVIRQWLASRDLFRSGADEALRDPRSRVPSSGLALLIWHSAGSIDRAALTNRNRNLVLSILVLGFFASTAVLFHYLYRRSHRLRRKEQEFVATVTHELRTPVAAMHAAAENLAQGVVTRHDRVQEYGRVMLDEGRRLRAMIDQTLLYAGLSGRKVPSCEEIDLAELARTVPRSVPEFDASQLSVVVEPRRLPYRGNRMALESILVNLLSNAAKHNPAGIPITLSVRAEAGRKRDRLVLEVKDEGSGIPKGELSHVREPFFRGVTSRKRQTPGTGLGLNIVERIVTMLGGRLLVESTEGEGTIVTVRLPLEAENAFGANPDS